MIYIASKVKHAARWRKLRERGVPIRSSWIDEAGEGETTDWPGLWERCIDEASSAYTLVVYCEPGEQLKGALAEVGAALANGTPVYAVGIDNLSICHHPLVTRASSLAVALGYAIRHCQQWFMPADEAAALAGALEWLEKKHGTRI